MIHLVARLMGFTAAAFFAAGIGFAGAAHHDHHHGRHHRASWPGSGTPTAARNDMQVFHFLLANRETIRRSVDQLPNGIATLTESSDPAVVEQLQEHVAAMVARLELRRPIRMHDPLFAELFRNAEHVRVQVERLPTGVRVRETSDDAYTVALLREHARVVGLFIDHGFSEMHRDHPAPPR